MSYYPDHKGHSHEEAKGHDRLGLPSREKYLKEKGREDTEKCHCHENHDHHEDYHHRHHNHPNEKSCHCREHHSRCHHGYETPYHHYGHHDCHCRSHHHHGCHHHHHNHCRRDLCDDDFRLRLGGLLNNLNFKLRQLIGCIVDMELEDGRSIEAEICYVGSNFVEVKKYEVEEPVPVEDPEDEEPDESLDNPEAAAAAEEDQEEERHCYSWIIPVDKIKYVEVYHGKKC
ncbi:hypothetical protein [Bacillus sp. AK031]